MAKYFELTGVSKYHIIALLVPIFCMSTTYIQKYQLKYYNNNLKEIKGYDSDCEEKKCKIREFPFFFNIFISKILSIFFVFLRKYLNKNQLISSDVIETKLTRRYHIEVKNKKIKVCLLIFIISILEVYFKFEGYVTYEEPNYIELKLGIIFLVPIFSIFILKRQIYRHHIFSSILSIIGIIFVCLSLLFIYENESIPETKKQKFGEQMRHLFFSIYLSLAFVLIKYLFEKTFINAFVFLFFDGILSIFLPFVLICLKSIKQGSEYFEENMKDISILFHDGKSVFYFIAILFCSFFYYLTNTLTLYFFTPTFLVSTDILSPFFRWIIELIYFPIFDKNTYHDKKDNEDFALVIIFKLIGFLIIIFSALINNEILVLHFCDFDKNIEKNIQKRGDKELSINDDLNGTVFSIMSFDERNNSINNSINSTFLSEIN